VSLPVLDVAATAPADLLVALQRHGALLVTDPSLPMARTTTALRDAAAFFDLPAAAKQALAIAHSPHFRGYSEMHNERDWREQIHFGREEPVIPGSEPHGRLQGPNLWPDDVAWALRMREWLHGVERLGVRVLEAIAQALGVASAPWLGGDPYLLMKLIGYHPQPAATPTRQGVAAHLDFSLVTLTLQDDVGGLQVCDRDGVWHDVPTVPGALLVNIGELLQYTTGNRLVATPHRVVNPSVRRRRVSIPVFVNPSLAATLVPALPPLPLAAPRPTAHVHAVLDPATPPRRLPFGPAEWRRKGENVWCTTCCAASSAAGR